ncbi:hypothetical protein, partial, partial [Parasitella parasitica]
SDQIKLIAELHKAGSTPTSIREALVQQNPGQMITQKSVYNAIARAKMVELNGLTPIQFLIEQLDEKTYKFETVVNGDNDITLHLSWMRHIKRTDSDCHLYKYAALLTRTKRLFCAKHFFEMKQKVDMNGSLTK